MVSNIDDKKQFVQSLSVYELRGLARALGINSPTTKVREKLIEEITSSLSSGQAIPQRATKKGRPSKELANIGMILDVVMGEKERPSSFDKLAVFNQDVPVFATKSADLERMRGVIKLGGSFVYFDDLRSSSKVFIDDKLNNQVRLFNGDFVEVEASKISQNQFMAQKIIAVNFVPFEQLSIREKILSEKILPSQFMGYEAGSILLGGRNVLETDNGPLFMCNSLKNLLDYISNQNAYNIFIGFNMCYEDQLCLKAYSNLVPIITDYESDENHAAEKVIDAINMVTNLNAFGKNVNIIIYDFAEMIAQLDSCYCAKQSPAQETSVLIKKLISLAGAYSAGQNTTLIATYGSGDKNQDTIKHELLKISNNIMKVL